jgi:type I restriction enzyme M protein
MEDGYIKRFDRVLANPPFSENYTRANMQFAERFNYGFTPENGKKADLMFLQHMIASLKDNGVMATVMPHGVLFRGGQEKVIRERIVRDDLIEAIIGLPPKLFYNTSIPACIIVINKNKPEHLKSKILFINADREYGEGRNQNFLRPEDIEKIVTVFEEKKEIQKYSRLVDIREIEENDYNLNIRRYVDNSPDPEIEDVRAHLAGGVPRREVQLYEEQLRKFGISYDIILKERDENYLEFKDDIIEKNQIREIVENAESVKATISKNKEQLLRWWKEVQSEIEKFYGRNNLWNFRNRALKKLKDSLLPLGTLDEFKTAGVFANWWEDLLYDFKSIVSAGWNKSLIDNERIKEKYFRKEMEEIEELENKVAEIDAELNELLEEVEEWDEEEQGDKTANKVKNYLKELVKELKSNLSGSAQKEAKKWEDLIAKINEKEKELKKARNEVNKKQKELEEKVSQKIETLTEEEAKGLILEKFYEYIDMQLNKYLNAEKKEIIKIFENLWDKYKISLNDLIKERDEEIRKLNEFLSKLGCYYG